MIQSLGFDAGQGVNLYQCDVCGEMYGKIPGSKPIDHCERCRERETMTRMKQRVHKAQHVAIHLQRAILKHKEQVDAEYDATDADMELWAKLEELDIPNDSPSGILAVLDEPLDADKG